jgi:2-phosphoglycerate kinase
MSEADEGFEKVFWLGGSPCSGKSSISEILAARFDLDVYHADEAFETHRQRVNSAQQPALSKWLASSWNDRWTQPVESLVLDAIACYREHFSLIADDIAARPSGKPLLIEGTALLPREVAGRLRRNNQAIWVIPTASFQTEHYSKREWARTIVGECDNPEIAFHNWMERDRRFAEWIEAETSALGLQLLKIDGNRTIAESAEEVARRFELSIECEAGQISPSTQAT